MKYVIFSPPYNHNSAGVRALYELQKHLIRAGENAIINNVYNGILEQDDIVIYPEVEKGNPSCAKNVVRYVLFYPGVNGGDKEFDSDELIFTYHENYYPTAPVLCVPVIEDFFKNAGLLRIGKYVYIHKGVNVPKIAETKDLPVIDDWNLSRKQLAHFLNTIEVLYTYDNCTALIAEAKKCGCKVIVIGKEEKNIDYEECIKDFPNQLKNFIEITHKRFL